MKVNSPSSRIPMVLVAHQRLHTLFRCSKIPVFVNAATARMVDSLFVLDAHI
jgi:hypothetical protein